MTNPTLLYPKKIK